MFITFYIYALIGVEIFHYSHEEYKERYYNDAEFATYSNGILGNMESFSEAFLALFQVLTGSSWHYVVFHVEEFNGFFLTNTYFTSFHLIITYILRSILQGMIWEVFIIVASNSEDYEKLMEDSEPDSDNNSDVYDSGFIPALFPFSNKKQKTIVSSTNIDLLNMQENSLYKKMFNVQVTNAEIKSMKRFMKRKAAVDNLTTKYLVPKKFWKEAIKTTIASTAYIDEMVARLSTIVAEPRMIGTPLYASRSSKRRSYINRPVSPSKYKDRLKINRLVCNTEILVCQEISEESDFESEEESNFTDSTDERFEFYTESGVDKLSMNSGDPHPKKSNLRRAGIIPTNQNNVPLKMSQTIIRKKTLVLKTIHDDEFESDEENELELDGDYILRTALLKDQDIQELSAKEMKYCLHKIWKLHLGKDEMGTKIYETYKKPKIKEITEEEVNTIVIQFLRDIRKHEDNKTILDLLDDIQQQIEKICPFGSMMRIMYKLDSETNKHKDSWVIPNREETYSGMVRVHNFMSYFFKATNGNTPILIKDVFEQSTFSTDKFFSVTVNGKKKIVCDELADMWLNVVQEISSVTNGNLHSIPTDMYQFHLFCIPLKHLSITKFKKSDFIKQNDEDDVVSLSSLASMDDTKEMISQNAMIMFFLCKKKKGKNQLADIGKQRASKFSFNINAKKNFTKIRTRFLIQALHDIADIFGAHHEKIFACISELYELNELSREFMENLDRPILKRNHSM